MYQSEYYIYKFYLEELKLPLEIQILIWEYCI